MDRPVDLQISVLKLQELALQQRASEALHPHEEELKKLAERRRAIERDAKVGELRGPEGGKVEREGGGGAQGGGEGASSGGEAPREDPSRELGIGRLIDVRS